MRDAGIDEVGRPQPEPLVRLSDLSEYGEGLARRLSGEWDEERWTAYRVRFGVYGQRQPGVQMVRIKIPGGIVPLSWLRTIATANRDFAQGDAHVTTRQDIQIYSVPLERTGELLELLYSNGVTTREACGNTLRNVTACSLAGFCPREHVDAGAVAEGVARAWLRAPLVQHMPRKVKISVSGCATDCGASAIHDLGFVADVVDGRRGFHVYAGGGLGGAPRTAVKVLDLVDESELPAVVEALARLHQRYSDRRLRNASRVKFLLKRFGEDRFRSLFVEEFERVRGLPQRPWQPPAWRQPGEAAMARTPMGKVAQHDGRVAIVANPPLGLLSSDRLERLADIAQAAGLSEIRTTRDQNVVLPGIAPEAADRVAAELKALGLEVPERAEDIPDVISCPGTTTCRIGITNSQNFAAQVLREAAGDDSTNGISVRVSGCQNSCGLHHVGDFGLHGMAKKIDGRVAPHYQLHLGGDSRQGGDIALAGPIVPARLAPQALKLLRQAYAPARAAAESVRAWAERLGKDGLAAVLAPIQGADADGLFVDWGESDIFAGAPQTKGECAAPMVSDSHLADLADDALIRTDRALAAGRWPDALAAAEEAMVMAARRLLLRNGVATEDEDAAAVVVETLRGAIADAEVVSALDAVLAERAVALGSGQIEAYRESVAYWIDTVRAVLEAPPVAPASADLSAFGEL